MTKRFLYFGLLAMTIMPVAGHVHAETVIARYLEFGTTASDNISLAEFDQNSELVFSVKPSVELKFSGNRIGTVVVAEGEHFRYIDAKKDTTDPRLFARTRGTLIDNLLYLDAKATYSKLAPGSNFLRPTDDSDSAINLKGQLFVYREFGERAELYIGLNHTSAFEEIGESATTDDNGLDFSLGRNPKYGGFLWRIGGSYYEDESAVDLYKDGSVFASVGGAVSNTLYFNLTAGKEARNYVTGLDTANPVTEQDKEADTWNAAFTLTPSERTSLTVGYGESLFSKGPNMELRHRTQNSTFKASYTRDVTRSSPSLGSISTFSDNTGLSQVDPDTVTIDTDNQSSALNEPFVQDKLTLSYKLTGRRSDLIIDGVYSEQEQITGDQTIKSLLGRVILDRKLSDLTSLRLQYDHQRSDDPIRQNRTYDENRLAIKFILNFDKIESSRDDEFVDDE